MATLSFSIGNKFQHYNGYIWIITSISGKTIGLESKDKDGGEMILKANMPAKDLQAIIKMGYYKEL